MRSLSKILSFLSSFVFLVSSCYAATITGTVKGPDGAPFEGAFVQARNLKSKITVSVLSNKDGHYRVEKLPEGDYELRIRAIGYKGDPRTGVNLKAEQNASFDFSLQKGIVRWSDLTLYQGTKLLPEAPGKQTLVRTCFGCHGFESRMAAVRRDEDGWRDRVEYMRVEERVRVNPDQENQIISYLTKLFGPDSELPPSPVDLPAYKDVAQHFSDDAMRIVYVEYDLPGPGRFPFDANPDKDGNVWMPYMSQLNEVAKLDPKTAEVQEFKLPNQPQPRMSLHSAVAGPDGTVWFTEQNTNRIGELDPQTKEVNEHQDVPPPAAGGPLGTIPSKHTVRIDPRGMVWATGTPFSSYDPKTKKFTEYPDPPNTYGIALDKDGSHVWFDGFTPDGKLYEVDTRTGKLMGGWAPPTHGLPRRIQVADEGMVWFAEYRAGKVGRFDPKTETFKEYQLPGQDPTPYAFAVDKEGAVWYSSDMLDVIGRLDPNTGKVVEYPYTHFEATMREFNCDSQGRVWFASPANNKVGYFYLTK